MTDSPVERPSDWTRRVNRCGCRAWSSRYGDQVAGWWFDGGYQHIDFHEAIARIYADAVKRDNPRAIVTFNPGVKLVRHTRAEDYTAGELNEPFTRDCWTSRRSKARPRNSTSTTDRLLPGGQLMWWRCGGDPACRAAGRTGRRTQWLCTRSTST